MRVLQNILEHCIINRNIFIHYCRVAVRVVCTIAAVLIIHLSVNSILQQYIDWWQQDHQSECECTEYKHYIGHIIASYCLQSFVISHILLQISYFKRSTKEHKIHSYLSFGCLFVGDYKGGQMINILCPLVCLLKY